MPAKKDVPGKLRRKTGRAIELRLAPDDRPGGDRQQTTQRFTAAVGIPRCGGIGSFDQAPGLNPDKEWRDLRAG